MVKIFVRLILLFLLAPAVAVNAQSVKERAMDYNDVIVDAQNNIGLELLKFNQGMSKLPEDSVRQMRKEIIDVIIASTDTVRQLGEFEGNDEFRAAAIELFDYYREAVMIDYKDVLDLLYAGVVTHERMSKMEDIFAGIAYQQAKLDKKYTDAQARFAEQFGFDIGANRVEEQLGENQDD